jgi:RNA polymerase sigma-70 factor (ECF subfamily)
MGHCQELELVNRVRNVVASLPVEQRQVISLVDLAELSYCEVAEALDVPIGTVMSRLHRARKNLLNKLDNPAVIPFRGNARIHLVE